MGLSSFSGNALHVSRPLLRAPRPMRVCTLPMRARVAAQPPCPLATAASVVAFRSGHTESGHSLNRNKRSHQNAYRPKAIQSERLNPIRAMFPSVSEP